LSFKAADSLLHHVVDEDLIRLSLQRECRWARAGVRAAEKVEGRWIPIDHKEASHLVGGFKVHTQPLNNSEQYVSNKGNKSHTKAKKDSQALGKGPIGGLRENGWCEYRGVTTCVSGFHKPFLAVSNEHDEVSAVSTIYNRLLCGLPPPSGIATLAFTSVPLSRQRYSSKPPKVTSWICDVESWCQGPTYTRATSRARYIPPTQAVAWKAPEIRLTKPSEGRMNPGTGYKVPQMAKERKSPKNGNNISTEELITVSVRLKR
jgi:hypothetical protein